MWRSVFVVVLASACLVEGGKDVPPVVAGPGVLVNPATQEVSADPALVPLLEACPAGRLVRRSEDGTAWDCVAPQAPAWSSLLGKPDSFAPSAHTHVASDVTDFALAAREAMGFEANDNPLNHARYTDAEALAAVNREGVPWSLLAGVPSEWPGSVPWSRVSGVGGVWPGSIPWDRVTDAPAVWPGSIPWSRVSGAPDVDALTTRVGRVEQNESAVETDVVALRAKVWCLERCEPARLADCRARTCDGAAERCVDSGSLPDGTACANGGHCRTGACCVAKTCAQVGAACGSASDGCGGQIWCGTCDGLTTGVFGGNGSDGALTISSGRTVLNLGGANVFVRNFSSIAISGTGQLAFSNPAPTGTVVILKSTGDVALTSSAVPNVDLRLVGSEGGAGATVRASLSGQDGSPGKQGDLVIDGTTHYGLAGRGGSSTYNVSSAAGGIGGTSGNLWTVLWKGLRVGPGAGGGGGGSGGDGANNDAGAGGAGGRGAGGLILELAGTFSGAGSIDVSGETGVNGSASTATGSNNSLAGGGGGGGGGGAGTVLVVYGRGSTWTGTVTRTGGSPGAPGDLTTGTGGGTVSHCGGGGGGGGGGGSVAASGAQGNNGGGGGGQGGCTGGAGGGGGRGGDGAFSLQQR